MDKYITYGKYNDSGQLDLIINLLDENKIPYSIEDNSRDAPDIIIGQDTGNKYLIKILPDDFIKVNSLLDNEAQKELDSIEKDYYLFLFSNEELLEVISQPDSWCALDRKLAKKLLNERGIEISDTLEKTFFDKRINELTKKEESSTIWMIVGYISAFLGGFLGIAIGLTLWTHRKILPNGNRVFVYKSSDRTHGMIIFFIGVFIFLLTVFYFIGR